MKTWNLMVRVIGTGVLTAFLSLVAFVLAAVGTGQYLEDYCFTRVVAPAGAQGGRGPIPEGLTTFRCQWEGAPDLVLTDSGPLGWVILVASAAGVVAAWLWWGVVVHPWRAKAGSRLMAARVGVGALGLMFAAIPAMWMLVYAWSSTFVEVLIVALLLVPAGLAAFAGTWLGVDGNRHASARTLSEADVDGDAMRAARR